MNVIFFLASTVRVNVSGLVFVNWYTYAELIDIVTLSGPICLLITRYAFRIVSEMTVMEREREEYVI